MKFKDYKTRPKALGTLKPGNQVLVPVNLAAKLVSIEDPGEKGLSRVTWEFSEVNVRYHTYCTRYTSVDVIEEESHGE